MSQVGWYWQNKRWLHEDLKAYAALYPTDFPYTAAMLDGMFQREERPYISPTMLAGCPRETVIKQQTPYYEVPDNAWTRYRGTIAHLLMERERNEPDAILETKMAVRLAMPTGEQVLMMGTPDKLASNGDGTWTLIDYKTVQEKDLGAPAKAKVVGWTHQLNCYIWMLAQHGKVVTRAFVQQIGMKGCARVEILVWPLAKTEAYIVERVAKFAPVFEGEYSVEKLVLPPMLDPVLDSEQTWRCNSSWCPVRFTCFTLRDREERQRVAGTVAEKFRHLVTLEEVFEGK